MEDNNTKMQLEERLTRTQRRAMKRAFLNQVRRNRRAFKGIMHTRQAYTLLKSAQYQQQKETADADNA